MRKWFPALKNTWKLAVLLFLVVLTFSYAMFQGGFVSWFLFYSFMPFALYSLALAFYPAADWEFDRRLSKYEFNAGEPLKISVVLKRPTAFPLFYLIVEDVLNDRLKEFNQKKKSKLLLFPGFKKEVTLDYSIDELPRGEHLFRRVRIKSGDLLGFIEKEKELPGENKIIVYPAFTELVYRPFENHFDQGMTASRERVQRDTTMAIGVRDYQPGDRFSWINWKASAKRNEIMTKEFEQSQSHDVLIVMDCAPDRRFEAVVSFTASLVRSVLKKGAQAGFLSVSKERASFPIRGGESQLQQVFYYLAKVQPVCSTSLDRILETESFYSVQSITLMIVTAQLTRPLIEKASMFGQRKGAVTLFLLKNEKESPSNEEVTLSAMATVRGVKIIMVHENQFAAAFSGVNLR